MTVSKVVMIQTAATLTSLAMIVAITSNSRSDDCQAKTDVPRDPEDKRRNNQQDCGAGLHAEHCYGQ